MVLKGFTEYEINSDDDVDFILYRQHHVSINFKVSKDTNLISSITISVYDKEDIGINLSGIGIGKPNTKAHNSKLG